ncbi:hypothetical protein BG006_004643 [Podila minutissima]|uniref:Uncharacterized protein n=1 Tax=Podila minutissima TaxID=64525 RepID=A0A9P5SKT6_9FUNG|nr:hypothetical protein BG006_004643 [Podila minutissima]
MYIVRGSKSRVKVVIPTQDSADSHKLTPNVISDVGMASRVDYDDEACLTPNLISTIHFLIPSKEMFHSVATFIFGTQNELVQSMQDSVNNSTLTTLPADELEKLVIMEFKMTGIEVVALLSVWARQSIAEVPHIVCVYTIASALITKPQSMDPDISRRSVNKGLNPTWTNITTTAQLSYLPRVSKNSVSFDIPKILNKSLAVTRHFASLGNNFIVDWEGSMLYVVFDIVEILKGHEILRWLFISVIGVMVACFVFWVATKFLVEARYRESLYMTASRELIGGRDGAKPRLHRFDPKTLEFEGQSRESCPHIVATSVKRCSGVSRSDSRWFPRSTYGNIV